MKAGAKLMGGIAGHEQLSMSRARFFSGNTVSV